MHSPYIRRSGDSATWAATTIGMDVGTRIPGCAKLAALSRGLIEFYRWRCHSNVSGMLAKGTNGKSIHAPSTSGPPSGTIFVMRAAA